jgi:hypothetical protein
MDRNIGDILLNMDHNHLWDAELWIKKPLMQIRNMA